MRGYILAEVEITNPEGYKAYSAMVPATIEKFGGKFLSRGGAQHAARRRMAAAPARDHRVPHGRGGAPLV